MCFALRNSDEFNLSSTQVKNYIGFTPAPNYFDALYTTSDFKALQPRQAGETGQQWCLKVYLPIPRGPDLRCGPRHRSFGALAVAVNVDDKHRLLSLATSVISFTITFLGLFKRFTHGQ
jgi:hypothetical protein